MFHSYHLQAQASFLAQLHFIEARYNTRMVFYKIAGIEPVAEFLAERLKDGLQKGSVLWLVPGGSAIAVAAAASQQLSGQDLSGLSVTLTDERYGPLDHLDSNWRQLREAGFRLPGANLVPVLAGEDRDFTTQQFAENLDRLLNSADYTLGFFGVGPDGHTAGILPGSPAVSSDEWAASYDAGNFERITITPKAIKRLNEVVVYGVGEPKWPIFDQLETEQPLDKQPAQALKTVAKLTIFNDYKGENR